MQHLLLTIGKFFRKSLLVLGLVSLLGLSNLLMFANAPANAAKLNSSEKVERAYNSSEGAGNREESYEEAVEAAKNPTKMEKAYEEDLEEYKESQPDTGLIEGAKDLVEKVTGK